MADRITRQLGGKRMPDIKGAEVTRGTWRDWMPDWAPVPPASELITRDELLKQVNERMDGQYESYSDVEDPDSEFHDLAGAMAQKASDFAKPVTKRTLQSWETKGILPRPIYGTRDGSRKALYPPWQFDMVLAVASSPRYGKEPEKLARIARWWMWRRLSWMAMEESSEWTGLQEAALDFVGRYVGMGGDRPWLVEIAFYRDSLRPYDSYHIQLPKDKTQS